MTPERRVRRDVPAASNRNVDLLFLIDDSSSMRLSQDNLMRNFPRSMNALENLPGGLPNVHIAVISSDMGAGDGSVAGCDTHRRQERDLPVQRRAAPARRPTCSAGATYISNIGGVRNYTGNLADVFTCIAALGESGCGFEHQFAAITRALGADGQAAPAENQGFLRPDAYLAIVMITERGRLLRGARRAALRHRLEHQHRVAARAAGELPLQRVRPPVCDGAAPPSRNAPNNDVNDTVSYAELHVQRRGRLPRSTVADTASADQGAQGRPTSQIMVAAITGAPSPYVVRLEGAEHRGHVVRRRVCPWPVIAHACTAADGSFADPAVRINELVQPVRRQRPTLSICDDDFSPALSNIAARSIEYCQRALHPGTDREAAGHDARGLHRRQPHQTNGGWSTRPCPRAPTPATPAPCWQPGRRRGRVRWRRQIRLGAGAPPAIARTPRVDCALCVPGMPDPTRGCP